MNQEKLTVIKLIILILPIVAIGVTFCGCDSAPKETLYVYCDNVLSPAVTKVVSQFEKQSNYAVKLIFDPEDRAFRRMKLSKHADLFIAITPELIEKANAFELAKEQETVCNIVPILITAPLNPMEIDSVEVLRKQDSIRLGIVDPDTTFGKVTKEFFEKNGFDWEVVNQALHYPAENEAELFDAFSTSKIDLAVVWDVTARQYERITRVPIPPERNSRLPVVAMLLKKSEHPEAVSELYRFLKSPEAQTMWTESGLERSSNL